MHPAITQAITFTNTYKDHSASPKAIREAACYQAQYPALLGDIRPTDRYAGRRSIDRIVYVGSVWWYPMPDHTPQTPIYSKQGGYCFDFGARDRLNFSPAEAEALEDLHAFWLTETVAGKVYKATTAREGIGFLFANNLDRLIQGGLPGLVKDVANMPDSDFKTGLQMLLKTIDNVFAHFEGQAKAQGQDQIAKNLASLRIQPPQTLEAALQLILLYELLTHESHYELNRLDVALGDIYAQELDRGTLTEAAAVTLIHDFYKMIRENGETAVCRLIMGGKHRRNHDNADRFITAALKAKQAHKEVIPQVTIRLYDGLNPDILSLAYDTINITGTFPTLYNDDAIIPGVGTAFDVCAEEAKKYYPLGCGEFILAHHSPALLVASWDVPAMVDRGMRRALANNASDYETLYANLQAEMAADADYHATYHKLLFDINGANCAFLAASMMMEDCLGRGKPLMDGGAEYIGTCVMGHGFTNAGDALTAIKTLVYDQQAFTLEEIVAALDANFEGHENIRKALTSAPKYGNDHTPADTLVTTLWRHMTEAARKAGKANGLDFFTVSSVNPGGYHIGLAMGATADGRLAHTPYAIGNAPTAGNDKSGITALMNSVLCTDIVNGGSVTNFKISREFFTKERAKFEALFDAYWADGGLQANITILSKGDLEAAMENPQNYPNLMVRIGGWSARFIDQDKSTQQEILKRTLY